MIEHVKLLNKSPSTIRRPLTLIDGISYAATWLPVQVTCKEKSEDGKMKDVTNHERRLFILRNDGKLFDQNGRIFDKGTENENIGVEIYLPAMPSPIKIMSHGAIITYQEGYRPAPPAVFSRVVEIVDYFIDFNMSLADQHTMAEMIACFIISTWFLDAFNVIGMLWPNGDRGCGKTQLLSIIAELSYLGQLILAGGSYASLRDLSDYGATLAFDDAESVADARGFDHDKRSLLLAGNRRGATVTVKEQGADKRWYTRHVDTYCPRLFSATRLPDPVLESRAIVIPLVRTADREKANSEPSDYSTWPHDRKELIDELWQLALCHLPELPKYERRVNEEARLTGRNLEPWKAMLAVALWLDEDGIYGLWERMEDLSFHYQDNRNDLRTGDLTTLVIKALCHYAINAIRANIEETPKSLVISTDQITTLCQQIAEEEEMEVGYISNKRIGRVLGSLRFEKVPRTGGKGSRQWKVSLEGLKRLTDAYALKFPDPLFVNGTNGGNGSDGSN